jgi:hypothetical protein
MATWRDDHRGKDADSAKLSVPAGGPTREQAAREAMSKTLAR